MAANKQELGWFQYVSHLEELGVCVFQATMLAEHVIEHVSARLGLDPIDVRERNFLQLPGVWRHLCLDVILHPLYLRV